MQAKKIASLQDEWDRLFDEVRNENLIIHWLPEVNGETEELLR
jgi:hypothetical protein